MPITGLSLLTAEIPLVLYTLADLRPEHRRRLRLRAAPTSSRRPTGWATRRRQRLWRVELPLAVPLIVAGLRLASVSTIGLVTVTGDPRRPVRRPRLLHLRGLPAQLPDRDPVRRHPVDRCSRSRSTCRSSRVQRRLTPWSRGRRRDRSRCGARRGGLMEHRRRDHRLADRPRPLVGPERHPDPARRAPRALAARRSLDRAARSRCRSGSDIGHTGRGARARRSTSRTSGARSRRSRVIGIVRADHRPRSTRSSGSRFYPTLIAMVVLGDPADPGQHLRRDRGGRPRPRRGRPRAWACASGQVLRGVELPLALAGDRRRASARRPSRSSRRRRSARSSASAASAATSSRASRRTTTAMVFGGRRPRRAARAGAEALFTLLARGPDAARRRRRPSASTRADAERPAATDPRRDADRSARPRNVATGSGQVSTRSVVRSAHGR